MCARESVCERERVPVFLVAVSVKEVSRVIEAAFGVWSSGFRVQGSGFGVQGVRFRILGSGFRVQGLGR